MLVPDRTRSRCGLKHLEGTSESLQAVLVRTISLGGDTDTIASIAGQISGTVIGSHGVPRNLVADVEGSDEVVSIAGAFAEFVDRTAIGHP
jgi:ADP-ribosylglycohydrolase